MTKIDDRAHPTGSDGEPSLGWLRGHLARLRSTLQDRLWAPDEQWAADRGYDSWRSRSGWTVSVRDPRFDRRQECGECGGTGFHRITGAGCAYCDGVGVVTLPDPDPDPDRDPGQEPDRGLDEDGGGW